MTVVQIAPCFREYTADKVQRPRGTALCGLSGTDGRDGDFADNENTDTDGRASTSEVQNKEYPRRVKGRCTSLSFLYRYVLCVTSNFEVVISSFLLTGTFLK